MKASRSSRSLAGSTAVVRASWYSPTSRILFVRETFGSSKIEDFGLDRVSSIEEKSGMMMSELKVFASGNDGHIKSIVKADASAFADAARKQLRQRQMASRSVAPAVPLAAPQPTVDPLEQLKKLGQLQAAGIITAAEFEAKKATLMALI